MSPAVEMKEAALIQSAAVAMQERNSRCSPVAAPEPVQSSAPPETRRRRLAGEERPRLLRAALLGEPAPILHRDGEPHVGALPRLGAIA